MLVTVLNNQSLADVSLQYTGTIENSFAIAVANDISITDLLIPGISIMIPDEILKDTNILNYYSAKKIQPATGLTEHNIESITPNEGINYWIIEVNFELQ